MCYSNSCRSLLRLRFDPVIRRLPFLITFDNCLIVWIVIIGKVDFRIPIQKIAKKPLALLATVIDGLAFNLAGFMQPTSARRT